MRYFLVLLLLCSPAYAAKKAPLPKPKPEVIEECVKSDVYIKAYADRFHLNVDRKLEFVGDSLIKLRNKMKELSEKIDNLPDNIDRVLIFRRSNQSSIILTFVKECGESIAIVPTDLIVSLLEDDSI